MDKRQVSRYTVHNIIAPPTFNFMVFSDPGETNFSPDWHDEQINADMKNLDVHSRIQQGKREYVSTPPIKDWVESCMSLVAALQKASDDRIKGDIAVAIGQQNEEMRLTFIQRGACVALANALISTDCNETIRKIDFSLRSLARHSSGLSAACSALVDALALKESLAQTEESRQTKMGVAFVIGKLAQSEDIRGILIEGGSYPALVAAVALERDAEAVSMFSTAIKRVSCDAHHRVTFIRMLFLQLLGDQFSPAPTFANTVSLQSQLLSMLNALSGDFETAVASVPGRVHPVEHSCLSKFCEAVNLHLHIRGSNFHDSDRDCEEHRRACSINLVIGSLLLYLGVLLSKNDARQANFVEGMFSLLPYDAIACSRDPWSASLYLNEISSRIMAVKRPKTHWSVTIDCVAHINHDSSTHPSLIDSKRKRKPETNRRDGSCALTVSLREHAAAVVAVAERGLCEYSDALCAVCQCSLFEIRSDGSLIVIARQLKCNHVFHADCARQLFVQSGASKCPVCRCVFYTMYLCNCVTQMPGVHSVTERSMLLPLLCTTKCWPVVSHSGHILNTFGVGQFPALIWILDHICMTS